MAQELLSKDNQKMALTVSRLILIVMLVMGVVAFFTQDHIVAKWLAAVGSVGIVFLLGASFFTGAHTQHRSLG